ncbi:MAG: glycosyltransferase family 25 protein [Candidatus Scalindua sp. AMX11]|nr:glycosyltransferase family 25 protein [Planctomycetota bacterium]RZV60526.1 MAG: glycosyltransferase family 25 protein [Candidatus Scalindua sp. SCAELEC01]TDE63115.1 MAG: glycosyltransferase family 25 protein [Candidatus Scalindua sp. AMX11]GJQ57565.1 MAG: hypothetical protein SCALA701_03660 [Candidatus Scalindua sp.]
MEISPINKYFKKIYCINLDRRTDRWKEMQTQFNKHNLEVTRFPATDGNPMGWKRDNNNYKLSSLEGSLGCLRSHTDLFKEAKKLQLENVLIIEDDCDFVNDLNSRFEKLIKEVPSNWDLLYFGGVHETRNGQFIPEKICDNLVRAKRIITTTCYAMKNTVYDLSINIILKDEPNFHAPIDGYLGVSIQPKCNTYAFHPPIIWQRASFSDVQRGHRDYVNMMKNDNIK